MDRKDRFTEDYTRAFSRLTASPEKIQEVIDMTENKRPRNIARRFLVGIAVAALLVVAAMGANAASGGELFARIVSYTVFDTEDGRVTEMTIEMDDNGQGSQPGEFSLYQAGEDGKAIMTYTDENGKQVSKEIDLDDAPTAQAPVLTIKTEDGQFLAVDAEGIALDHDRKTAAITYTAQDGKEETVVIDIPEKFREYESIGEMLVNGPISGRTQDGREYELSNP